MNKAFVKFLRTPPLAYYQYFKTRIKRSQSRKLIKQYLKQADIPRLTIGCGRNVLKGWLNTDLYPQKSDQATVVYLDAGIRFPFEDSTFDYIYSEHIFEHLTFTDSCNMLEECYRVLKPNGTMRLALPHFGFLLGLYQDPEADVNQAYIKSTIRDRMPEIHAVLGDSQYANVYVINNFYRDWGHEVIHSTESLKQLIETFQFKNVERMDVGKSDISYLSDLEAHARKDFDKSYYDLETLVFEAVK